MPQNTRIAEQQIDTPGQVKGQVAVVPEDGPEHQLREHRADILVSAANHGAEQKNEAVAALPVAVEQGGEQYAPQPPHDGKRAVHHTAPAHKPSGGEQAPDRLGDVAQKRADQKQGKQLVIADAVGKGGQLFPFLGDGAQLVL